MEQVRNSSGGSKEQGWRRISDNGKPAELIKLGVISVLVVMVWGVFSLPIIFYHLPQKGTESALGSALPPNSSINCSQGTESALGPELPLNGFINCSQGFSINSYNLCSPVCGEWEEFPHSVVVAFDTVTTLLYIFHLIGTILALGLSCYRYKFMFKFPSILLVYFLAPPVLFDVFHLIGFTWRDSLYCSSSDLIDSQENPTAFCSLSGVVNNFVFTVIDYAWFVHTITVFWKVWFPVNARNFERSRYYKYFHLIVVVIIFLSPWITIATAFGTGGYTITSFPPFSNCSAKEPDAVFYPLILPKCIVFPIGITMILCTIWKLLRVSRGSGHGENQTWCTCDQYTAEAKLMGILLYLSIAASVSLTLISTTYRKITEYQDGFFNYFSCEACGNNPAHPCVLELDRRRDQAFTIVSFAMYASSPYAILIYIINVGRVRAYWRSWKEKRSNTSSAPENLKPATSSK